MWIADENRPTCGDDEVMVVMMAAGLCATDIRVYTGERPVPGGRIGHEGIGVLAEVGASAAERGYRTGMTVVFDCNHPDPRSRDHHLDGVLGRAYKVPAAFVMSTPQSRLIPVDELIDSRSLSVAEGALLEPLTVALHAVDYVRRGRSVPREAYDDALTRRRDGALGEPGHIAGKNVMVMGAGTIGTFCAAFARLNGARSVTLVNRGRAGLELANRVLPLDHTLVEDEPAEHPEGGIDVVFIASHEGSISRATREVNDGGVIVLVAGISRTASLETDDETVALHPIRHDDHTKVVRIDGKTITVIGAHGTNEVLFREAARCFATRHFAAHDVHPSAQITHIVSLEALPHVFRDIAEQRSLDGTRVGKTVVDFRLSGDQVHGVDEYRRVYGDRADELLSPERSASMRDSIRRALLCDPSTTLTEPTRSSRHAFEGLIDTLENALRYEAGRTAKSRLRTEERLYLEKAFAAAQEIYAGMHEERRVLPDGRPFIFHVLEVARYASAHLGTAELAQDSSRANVRGLVEVAVGLLLHDSLEHAGGISSDWLARELGPIPQRIAEDLSQRPAVATGISDAEEANLAIKREHYRRLIEQPRYALSPALKLADNFVSYRMHLSPSAAVRKSRSADELALLRDFMSQSVARFAVPAAFVVDMDDCLNRYEALC
jgi:threonine dehydrogenase-like Zn-dependent dehydrogenase